MPYGLDMMPAAARQHRAWWLGLAAVGVLAAFLVVASSWGYTCSAGEDVVASGCTASGPRLGVISVFFLLADACFIAHAVRRARAR